MLEGGADNDTLIGGDHSDSMFGGTGVNVIPAARAMTSTTSRTRPTS